MNGPLSVKARRVGKAGDTDEVPLNAAVAQLAWDALSHKCNRMCLNEILKRLFAGDGIIFMRGKEKLVPRTAFDSLVRREFLPCAQHAFAALQAFGVVPVAFADADAHVDTGLGEKRLTPYVPTFGTYTITTFCRLGLQYFSFYWGGQANASAPNSNVRVVHPDGRPVSKRAPDNHAFGTRDDSVIVFANYGWNPDLDGRLNSNMSCLLGNILFHTELETAAITAEHIGSNPAVFTAFNPAAAALEFGGGGRGDAGNMSKMQFASSAQRQMALAAGETLTAEMVGQASYERTPDEMLATRLMMRAFQRRTGLDPFGSGPIGWLPGDECDDDPLTVQQHAANPQTGHVMPWANQFNLGATRQLVHQQMPHTRADLVQLTQQLQETACGVLGVPRTLIVADAGVRAGVEAVEATMNRTVQHWAEILGSLLTRIYRHLLSERDLYEELQLRVEQKRALLRARLPPGTPMPDAQDLITNDDLYEIDAKTDVTLSFDLVPITTIEQLDHMYERGIISWSVYAEAVLRINNMSRSVLATKKEPGLADLPETSPLGQQYRQEQAEAKLQKTQGSMTTKPAVKRPAPVTV